MAAKKTRVYVWREPGGLASAVTVVMVINLLVLLGLIVVLAVFGSASSYADMTQPTGPQLARLGLDLVRLPVILACVTLWVWIYRASENAHTFKSTLQVSPWGALLWYLVPIASLFKPFQAMSEIWTASDTAPQKTRNPLLITWWILFLANNWLAAIPAFIKPLAQNVPLSVVVDLTAAGVTVTILLIVRRVTAMQILMRTVEPFGEKPPSGGVLERLQS